MFISTKGTVQKGVIENVYKAEKAHQSVGYKSSRKADRQADVEKDG